MTAGTAYDAIVIGSGFGGSIAALRLAQAGKSVLVLERGRRYAPGEFPRDVTNVEALFWRYPRHASYRGLYDLRFFSSLAAAVASGVGGGSLIYANIHIRPHPSVFDDARWPRSINRASLERHYDKVAQMFGVAPLPQDVKLTKRDVFRDAAARIGRSVFDPDQAVSWNTASGAGRNPCRHVAECEFGCQYGAKNTLDFTYLAQAEALGARVAPGMNVSHIEAQPHGYRVHYTDVASGATASVDAARVVVSAGTLGTNEVLLRSRDVTRTLPKLSRRLGHGYSANGDFLGSIQNSRFDLEPWKGPDVTSVIDCSDSPHAFTLAAPTFNRPTMEVLASLGQAGEALRFLSPIVWPLLGGLVPWAFRKGLLSRPSRLPARNAGDPARMTNLFAIGRDNANGVISLKRGRIDIDWNYAQENAALVERMMEVMREVTAHYGGTFGPVVTWALFRRILTVHSLGGCRLSESPEEGVVSPSGEVHRYPGLYVADGSVIPTAIGFHPVMTISAVAEHIAEAIVAGYA
jgi:cholesterol oxidase